MIRAVLIITSLLILISPLIADDTGILNNTTTSGEQNLSNSTGNSTPPFFENTTTPFGQNLTHNLGNETALNLTNSSAGDDTNLTNKDEKLESTGVSPTPKPVYKQSIGSVYNSDYTEPQPRIFSYSGCS